MDEAQVEALIDDLEASEERRGDATEAVRDLLGRLPQSSATEVRRARLTLLTIDEVVRARSAADAALAIQGVRDVAVRNGHRALEARSERALSVLFREIGDPSASLERAVAATALDGDDLDPTLRCRLSLTMADALHTSGSFEEARARYAEALERSTSLSAPEMTFNVLNNWAYSRLVADDLEAAGDLADQLQELAEQHATPLSLGYVGTVAEVLHVRGRSAEAMAMLRGHLDGDHPHAVLGLAQCWLVLAEVERGSGDLEAAAASLDVAERITTTHGLQALRVEGLGERARLLAARGDHAGAYALHRRFHGETLALRSEASETRAQTLHAVFEVDEARRESTRYRQMSYRDPLTGLFNRRHVDADLDERLSTAAAPPHPLSIAMVDLDHFKRVNDTCSHEAGDAVLVRLAAFLETAAAGSPGAYAARLGGEEFLLVLPGAGLAAAHETAESLRRRIAAHDWSDLAPGLPVTASIGLATTPDATRPPPDRADLLRQADRHLYAAKDGGRNRVEPATGRPEAPPLTAAARADDGHR